MKTLTLTAALLLAAGAATAKLPPLSDEAKAKAAETAAKTAHTAKVADFQLCKRMDAVAAAYLAEAKKAGKTVQPVATPACADPGPFVYPPPDTAAAPAAPVTASTQGPAAAAPPKK